jgi:hypothetical protein
MAPPDDFVLMHEHGADRDAAFRKALPRLVDRRLKKGVQLTSGLLCWRIWAGSADDLEDLELGVTPTQLDAAE